MAKRSRKRKLENEDEAEAKWELTNILNAELREEMATMWELPQIFHFLHVSNDALNVPHFSMYEMERMLAIPRASKQLANIMTCLLSPPLPKAKMRKIPPMPYDFWVNVLTHKVQGWFKMYQSKHHDVIKVLETTGVEPEFWRIFPDASIIDDTDFDALSFKQRVWILKTLCDTLMHSRKTVQDAIATQISEDQYEIVLGADRYGAKYFYFPLFLDNDLRVYRHCIDNIILSTVRPPSWKEVQPSASRSERNRRGKRKRCRWQNGSLPRDRRRSKKAQDDDVKMSGDSAIGSSVNEDTNFSGTSTCSNNNNIVIEADSNRSDSPSKNSEDVTVETRLIKPKSSDYETNTSMSDAKSLNGIETEDMFRGFAIESYNENSSDAIDSIHDILDRLTSKVSELEKNANLPNDRASIIDENSSAINAPVDENEEVSSSNVIETKMSGSEFPVSRAESPNDDLNWRPYSPIKSTPLDLETRMKEMTIFTTLLDDLSFSTFELAADSVDSLRDLATSLMSPEPIESRRSSVIPKCEMMLARAMECLADSLRGVESKLKESTRKARAKLRKEWTNFKDGIVEDQETSGDPKRGSNRWIIGSQGSPLLSTSETTLQTLSDSALSPTDSENHVESDDQKIDDREGDSDKESNNGDSESKDERTKERRVKIKIEKANSDENDGDENSNDSQPQTRRVLRARGISSYTEQFTSEDEDTYELEEWSRVEALNATPSTSDGTSAINAGQKTGQTGDESEEKDSDQDWILPGARKRKSKRSPVNRRLKPLQQKLHSITSDSHDSNVSPPVPENVQKSKTSKTTKDGTSTDGSFICKVESVHSELDIKDEGPIFEFARNIANPTNVQDNYALPQRNPNTLPRLNYPRYPRQPLPPPPGMMPQQMPSAYYIQGPQAYFDPRFIRYSYPPPSRGGPAPYVYPPVPHQYPGHPNYWQPSNYPPLPPGMYTGNPRQPGYPPQRGPPIQQRHQAPSTTLYGARLPTKPPQNRMPLPRPTIPQNFGLRATAPRPRGVPVQPGQRRYAPRSSAPQAASSRMPRPTRPDPNPPTQPGKTKQKATSLILLSDSDDEIEMIMPEKRTATSGNVGQNRKPITSNKNLPAAGAKPKPRPVVTSQITVPKSSEVLSPQMIQRMSQGGISITPVKPPASKQKAGETSQGTKLVVVVNETGSHYALALPNGSKLILTPEQVAQIRASNGGKLVL